VAYIQAHPPEVWGPQQNAVVNGQLESAQAVAVSAEERAQIRDFADEVLRANAEDGKLDRSGQ
jgi:anti-sigma factor ChrR (cupin superfamily)